MTLGIACGMNGKVCDGVDCGLFQHYVPPEKLPSVMQVLHGSNKGGAVMALEGITGTGEFDVQGYSFRANEESRSPRIVRIGLIQNKIVEPTTSSFLIQKQVDRFLIDGMDRCCFCEPL